MTAHEVIYRPTTPEDEEFLWLMLYYASHSNDEDGVEPSDIRGNPDLVGYIEGWWGDRAGVVAEKRGQPVGAAWLRELTEADRDNPVFVDISIPELAIAVSPSDMGAGIGTTMLRHILELSRDRYPGIVLSARAASPAVRLYERAGFVTIATITNRTGTRSVKMYRAL